MIYLVFDQITGQTLHVYTRRAQLPWYSGQHHRLPFIYHVAVVILCETILVQRRCIAQYNISFLLFFTFMLKKKKDWIDFNYY